MIKALAEVLQANEQYSADFDKIGLAIPPARQFAILTCMDARPDIRVYGCIYDVKSDQLIEVSVAGKVA